MKFPQQLFDFQKNAGGGVIQVQRSLIVNAPDSPYLPTADDYGISAWTCDPADVTTAAQLTVSQTLYGALLVVPNTGKPANRLSLIPHTVQGAETNFNGVGLYSLNSTYTTATQIAVSANQTWTGVTPDVSVDAAFTTAISALTPGYYIATFLGSTSGTAMTLHGELGTVASAMNFAKNGAVSAYRSFTLAGQTTMPASITLSGTTPSAFIPFLALS
jgi:hypothetical protein